MLCSIMKKEQQIYAEMHNVYGHFMSRGTFEGIKELTGKRPFVII